MMCKILYVDDNIRNHLFVRKTVDLTNCKLYEAFDGEMGLETARQEQPTLILMDIHLAEKNSIDVIHVIKQSSSLQHIPIVALTSDSSRELEQECIAAGCHYVLHRPIRTESLLAIIGRCINES